MASQSTLVQANDCLFQVKIDDDYVTVLCAKSFTVTINTDEKETTTVTDGAYKSFDYKVLSYTANLNGAMNMPDNATPTTFDFVEYQKSFLEIEFRAAWIDPLGVIRTFKGTGIIKTNNLVASASQLADGTVDILGSGSFEIGTALDEFINLTIICTGNNSVPAFVKFWLINDQGDTIFLTDTLPQASGSMLGNPFNITVPAPKGIWYFYWFVNTNSIGNTITVNTPVAYSANFNNGISQFTTYPNTLYDFTADRTVTVTLSINNPPPTCVPPVAGALNNHDGQVGTPYNGTITITGTTPISLSNITKPSWMSISISANTVTLSGDPTAGINQVVSFDYTNACGSGSFSDNVDIVAGPANVLVNYNYAETDPDCAMTIYVNSVLAVQQTVAGSGSITVNALDVVEIFVIGSAFTIKHLDVQDSVSGELFDQTQGGNFLNFSFVAVFGHIYTINGNGGI